MLAILLALLSAACFGTGLVLTHLGLRRLSPLAGASISVPTSALIFFLLSPFTIGLGEWNSRSAMVFALVGLLYPAAVTLLTFEANRRIGASLTGALGNLTPVFAVMIAIVVLHELPSGWQLAGLALIGAGLAGLFYNPATMRTGVLALGVALPLLAALVRGLAQPMVKLGLEGWPNPFAASLIGYLVSALAVTAAARLSLRARPPRPVTPRDRLWFAAVGIANGGAVLTLYAALTRGSVAQVAPLVACYPIVTVLLGRYVAKTEPLSLPMLAGVAATVAGIGLLIV
ncbi:MAG: DMT family transporter [Variibacter sp.]|nr:DMT family transporter [Variibacter sp.]